MTTFYVLLGFAAIALLAGYLAGGADWFCAWMGDSETLVFARLNVLVGSFLTVADQVLPFVPVGELPWWAMAVVGAALELLRQRRAEDK
jgi:hypothetical protein